MTSAEGTTKLCQLKGGAKHCFKKNPFNVSNKSYYFGILVNAPRGVLLHVQEPEIVLIKILTDEHNHKNSPPNSIFYTVGLLVNVHKQKCNNGRML